MVYPLNKALCCYSSGQETGDVSLLFITSCHFFSFLLARGPPNGPGPPHSRDF